MRRNMVILDTTLPACPLCGNHASQIEEGSMFYLCTGCFAKLRLQNGTYRTDETYTTSERSAGPMCPISPIGPILVALSEEIEALLPCLTLQRFAAEEERLRDAQDRLILAMFPALRPVPDKRRGKR